MGNVRGTHGGRCGRGNIHDQDRACIAHGRTVQWGRLCCLPASGVTRRRYSRIRRGWGKHYHVPTQCVRTHTHQSAYPNTSSRSRGFSLSHRTQERHRSRAAPDTYTLSGLLVDHADMTNTSWGISPGPHGLADAGTLTCPCHVCLHLRQGRLRALCLRVDCHHPCSITLTLINSGVMILLIGCQLPMQRKGWLLVALRQT